MHCAEHTKFFCLFEQSAKGRERIRTMETIKDLSQELVELSGRLIGEKVLITDTAGIIVGCSDEERIGELHEASLAVLQTGHIVTHDRDSASSLVGTFAGVTLPLEFDGRLVGTVGITGDPARVSQYGQLIRAFAEMLVRYRAGQKQRVIRDQESRSLLREILYFSGAEDQKAHIIARAGAIGCDLTVPRAAVLIVADIPSDVMDAVQEAVDQAFNLQQSIAAVLSPRQILVLAALSAGIHGDPSQEQLRERCLSLHASLQKIQPDCVIGVGSVATGVAALQTSCEEAMLTARIAQRALPAAPVLLSEDVVLERMISAIPNRHYSRAATHAMEVIQEQRDAEEIKHMIRVWCQQSFSVSNTARALFIHKNTLLYRVERLQRLTGYDLRSFRDAMTLYLMIGMEQYQGNGQE